MKKPASIAPSPPSAAKTPKGQVQGSKAEGEELIARRLSQIVRRDKGGRSKVVSSKQQAGSVMLNLFQHLFLTLNRESC